MLRSLRSKLSSWLMLGFLVLAVGAIVITGFGTGGVGGLPSAGGGGGGETLVTVGGEEITADELERLIRSRLRQAQVQNPEVDMARFLQAGAFETLLEQLVVGRAMWAFGQEHGLVVSERMVDEMIVNIPAFRNLAGEFDDNVMRDTLRQQNMTEQQLRRELANLLMQRQLQLPVGLGARVPDSVVLQYASLLLERRRGSIGVVPTELLAAAINPGEAEIAAHYARNRARYAIPERRVLRYALVGREQVAASARASDEEIAAHYRENAPRYAGTETRDLQRVLLRDEAAARAFVGRAGANGANFAAAARQAGFGPADTALRGQSREQLTELAGSEVAAAAFSAAQGALVGPVRSQFGWQVVRVDGITRAAGRPLEAVRAEIAAEVERRKAEDALTALINRVEERLNDGASLDEVARDERLTVVETPPVTASGAAPGTQFRAPPELAALLVTAFQIDPDEPEPSVETIAPNERFAVLALARVVPSAVPPLAEVRDRVRADLIREQAVARGRAIARGIVARINAGVPVARAYAEAGMRLPTPEPVERRRIDVLREGPRVQPPIAVLFSLPRGRARELQAPNGTGWFVIHTAETIPGQASCPAGQEQRPAAQQPDGCRAIADARAELGEQVPTELTEQFARAAQRSLVIRRDEAAIRRLRQRLLAGTAQ